jgi:hypothetical protein
MATIEDALKTKRTQLVAVTGADQFTAVGLLDMFLGEIKKNLVSTKDWEINNGIIIPTKDLVRQPGISSPENLWAEALIDESYNPNIIYAPSLVPARMMILDKTYAWEQLKDSDALDLGYTGNL